MLKLRNKWLVQCRQLWVWTPILAVLLNINTLENTEKDDDDNDIAYEVLNFKHQSDDDV